MQQLDNLGLFNVLLYRAHRQAERPQAPDRHPIRANTARFLIRIGTWLEPQARGTGQGHQVVDHPTAQGVNG